MSQQEFSSEPQKHDNQQEYYHYQPANKTKKKTGGVPKEEHPSNYEEDEIPSYAYRAQDTAYQQNPEENRSSTQTHTQYRGSQQRQRPASAQQSRNTFFAPWWARSQRRPNIGWIIVLIILAIILLPILLKALLLALTIFFGFLFFCLIVVAFIALLFFLIWHNIRRDLTRWWR